ncbi:MAG: ABC transporter permease [Clostridiales bacterium]|nr:ABC transporter permease [Clostridiales bacterium]
MKFLKRFYLAIILLFLYAPILVMILFSFNKGDTRTNFTGLSFQWYTKMFQNDALIEALLNTLVVALCASVIATILGSYIAFIIAKMSPANKNISMKLLNIPMLNAEIVTGVSLMFFFVFISVSLGFTTLLIAHVIFDVPYVVLSILPRIRQMNKSVYEAALDLGATPAFAFRKIILPDIMPGVFSGALLAFTMSFDDFIISYYTSGPGFVTLSVYINTMTKRAIPLTINALSTFIFVVVFILLLITNFRNKKPNKEVA